MKVDAEIEKLRARWSGITVDQAWLRRKLDERASDETTWDLRGLPIGEMLKGLKLKNVDFSYATFSGPAQLIECQITGSKFRGITLGTNIGSVFEDCDFQDSELGELLFRGRFTRCNFSHSKLDNARGVEVSFAECDFTGCVFKKTDFKRCVFNSCVFTETSFVRGVLSGSRFVGKHPLQDAFKNVHMPAVSFS